MSGQFTKKMYDQCAYLQSTKNSTDPLELIMDLNKYVNCNGTTDPAYSYSNNIGNIVDIESSMLGIDRISSNCDSEKYPFCAKNGCILTNDPRIPQYIPPFLYERGRDGDNAVVTTNIPLPTSAGYNLPNIDICAFDPNSNKWAPANFYPSQADQNGNPVQTTLNGTIDSIQSNLVSPPSTYSPSAKNQQVQHFLNNLQNRPSISMPPPQTNSLSILSGANFNPTLHNKISQFKNNNQNQYSKSIPNRLAHNNRSIPNGSQINNNIQNIRANGGLKMNHASPSVTSDVKSFIDNIGNKIRSWGTQNKMNGSTQINKSLIPSSIRDQNLSGIEHQFSTLVK